MDTIKESSSCSGTKRQMSTWLRVTIKGKEGDPWWHPRRLLLKVVGVAVAAVASQFVVPSATPYLQMWAFQLTGFSVLPASFLVATTAEGTPSDTDPEYYRVFCGLKHKTSQYCVMRSLEPTAGLPLDAWKLDPKKHTKAVLWGGDHPGYEISWISQFSGTTGSASVHGVLPGGDYVGSGYACASPARGEPGRPMRIRVLVSHLGDLKTISDTLAIKTAILSKIGTSSLADLQNHSKVMCTRPT
jgi:hypothetical protein